MLLRCSILSLSLLLHVHTLIAAAPEDLVDLRHVATEQKGDEYKDIEHLDPTEQTKRIFAGMQKAAEIVKNNKSKILQAVTTSYEKFSALSIPNRRILIAGAGTSGRLAAIHSIEASQYPEIPNVTFNIAGGPNAFIKAVEGAEDNRELAMEDVEAQNVHSNDIVIVLSASGRTPYAIAYLEESQKRGALTISLDNSPESPLSKAASLHLSNHTGAECPRGSTRMKSGTSQYETLRVFTHLLNHALAHQTCEIENAFDTFMEKVDTILTEMKESLSSLTEYSLLLAQNLTQKKNIQGRILYIGENSTGLLGAVDGSELGPTYTWNRVAYVAPCLDQILRHETQRVNEHDQDVLIILGDSNDKKSEEYRAHSRNMNIPCIDLGNLISNLQISKDSEFENIAYNLATNIALKIMTTQFAVLSGWVLEGEMIHLDPNNPNKKLIARRVQTLKNLQIVENEEDAMALLKETENNLALAVIMKRKSISLQYAASLLTYYKGNVIQALGEMF